MADYAHPEVLVDTDWVKAHLNQPGIRLVEVDVDTKAYEAGHIPGAVGLNWQSQLNDGVRRDVISKEAFEQLMGACGIRPDDTVILYGDNNNWFAAFAFWIFKMYGHEDVKLMNGGRQKWLDEPDKELVTDRTQIKPASYKVTRTHPELRAMLPEVLQIDGSGKPDGQIGLVDVRSPDEFTGKVIAPPGMTETAQRGGHIPGAHNIPWAQAVREDGTFKSREELEELYKGKGVDLTRPIVAYCRIGERSSHSWFVLKYLLGCRDVKNYDGSWTEYGNLVGAPIEK
jgi:thiosulfate/3-mercaptopyruvate sulfurtransferase